MNLRNVTLKTYIRDVRSGTGEHYGSIEHNAFIEGIYADYNGYDWDVYWYDISPEYLRARGETVSDF